MAEQIDQQAVTHVVADGGNQRLEKHSELPLELCRRNAGENERKKPSVPSHRDFL